MLTFFYICRFAYFVLSKLEVKVSGIRAEERALELGVKISSVQHTFIEHLLFVPGARETKACDSGPLPSRSLHFCMDSEQVNKQA